jgi:hypothetical protein
MWHSINLALPTLFVKKADLALPTLLVKKANLALPALLVKNLFSTFGEEGWLCPPSTFGEEVLLLRYVL